MAGTPEEDQGMLAQVIEFLGLEGDEAQEFFKAGMERRGHKAKTTVTWEPGDGGKDKKPSNVLGLRTGQKKTGTGGDWQY